jgi:hypothetical protein
MIPNLAKSRTETGQGTKELCFNSKFQYLNVMLFKGFCSFSFGGLDHITVFGTIFLQTHP